MNKDKGNLLYADLTYKIRGAAFAVHNALGSGHKEIIYQKALGVELEKEGLNFIREQAVPIKYRGIKVGMYRPDFIVEKQIIIEIKATPFIVKHYVEQIQHYLMVTKYRLGLLINFGAPKVQIRRIIYDQARH